MKQSDTIYIKGARVHNLKNIDIEIPHNTLTVITGLSGSGKSTLAFDTIFAEGQRRYVESLSAYARQFLGKINKPDVDMISGIAPAIAIEQKVNTRNPRSTVGTSTEIYDYIKLLYARIGKTFSPISGKEVTCESVDSIVEKISLLDKDSYLTIGAPITLTLNQGLIEKVLELMANGVTRIFHDGKTIGIEEFVPQITTDIDLSSTFMVVDRLKPSTIDSEDQSRIYDSVARAISYGNGECAIIETSGVIHSYSTRFEADGMTFEEPTEHMFSFNNPLGACPRCEGYGKVVGIDEDLVIPDKTKTIYEDAIACWRGETMRLWRDQLISNSRYFDFPIHTPYYALTAEQKLTLWRGNEYFKGLDDFFNYIESERRKVQFRVMKARYTGKTTCPDCGGSRLRPEALYVKVDGKTIADIVEMTIEQLIEFFDTIILDSYESKTAARVLTEIKNRLRYLTDVGLGYLTLNRLSSTLSGGESQRINLATSLGSNLTGSLYILDEPSIGLHPRDTHRLISVLEQLRDLGNTVIVVEHEKEVMLAADYIVDIGPQAGYNGGEVVFSGTLPQLLKCKNSLTADYLNGIRKIERPHSTRAQRGVVTINGARENNLKNITVNIPLGVMSCVTGVSGSGKSSLVKGILHPALKRHIADSGNKPGDFDSLSGDLNMVTSVEIIDQNPIGKSSRSNPVTYLKAYDEIRKLYASQPYARHTGMSPAHFSFNITGGRCEECQGDGFIKVGMQFMADVELVCEVCNGRRFKDEVLEVKYNGKSIYDLLEMSVDGAMEFFAKDSDSTCKRIVERLKPLQDVGLGYIKLGQSSSTLSGGESQRVKLASFLTKENSSKSVMFIFDEPTTGLHFHDIKRLIEAFNALIDRGHTVVIVEHNMDVIKNADHIIDLGAEAGSMGGNLVFEGTPEDLTHCEQSYTAKFLVAEKEL